MALSMAHHLGLDEQKSQRDSFPESASSRAFQSVSWYLVLIRRSPPPAPSSPESGDPGCAAVGCGAWGW